MKGFRYGWIKLPVIGWIELPAAIFVSTMFLLAIIAVVGLGTGLIAEVAMSNGG
jgi:hypothetical protein